MMSTIDRYEVGLALSLRETDNRGKGYYEKRGGRRRREDPRAKRGRARHQNGRPRPIAPLRI